MDESFPGAADISESDDLILYLPENYDTRYLPVKAERLRDWWEEDPRTTNHAKFCLPLVMASGLGYYLLSPAKFTISWSGRNNDQAQVTVHERASHAEVTVHSTCGGFTIQTEFVAQTRKPGDFLYVKGVANQFRKPYIFLEACIEAWWNVGHFGLVAMCNQPGSFTIELGEPIAQMFVLRGEAAQGNVVAKFGMPPEREPWLKKRTRPEYTGKDLDYLKGQLPDGTPVTPHYRSWRGKVIPPPERVHAPIQVLSPEAPGISPAIRPERVVVRTIAGDLVYCLYSDVAPETVEQFLKLVRLGVYDSTHFNRIEPGFLIQSSTAEDRFMPLDQIQRSAIRPIKGEFTEKLKHTEGSLSMARWEDRPDSAETSYSILLGDAPHLDGKYAIFGYVEVGFDVLQEIVRVKRDGTRPLNPIVVFKMEIVTSSEELMKLSLAAARAVS